ncbi:MAG: hypothetical protein E3J72_18665 [Planctomycetota bacterium]|nr:MAG: hypothetical protein E3J72_18665 [Planctomycetota bacterium]
MATLSRKTLGIAVRILGERPFSYIEQFLFEMQVPDDAARYYRSKQETLVKAFRQLEENDQQSLLKDVIFGLVQRLEITGSEERIELIQSLRKDGFVVSENGLSEDVPLGLADENLTALEGLLQANTSYLHTAVLEHHLRESIDLFKQEKWDSSIGHARNFVEQLLSDIAKAVANIIPPTTKLEKPYEVRSFLEKAGFFSEEERKKLVDGVYGYFSEKGSHPGITEHSIARVSNHILWAFAYYILEKFEDWKSRNDV